MWRGCYFVSGYQVSLRMTTRYIWQPWSLKTTIWQPWLNVIRKNWDTRKIFFNNFLRTKNLNEILFHAKPQIVTAFSQMCWFVWNHFFVEKTCSNCFSSQNSPDLFFVAFLVFFPWKNGIKSWWWWWWWWKSSYESRDSGRILAHVLIIISILIQPMALS